MSFVFEGRTPSPSGCYSGVIHPLENALGPSRYYIDLYEQARR